MGQKTMGPTTCPKTQNPLLCTHSLHTSLKGFYRRKKKKATSLKGFYRRVFIERRRRR
jgi:hypothetical protein